MSWVSWMMDDITWCADECDNKECFRHLSHKSAQTRFFSMSNLKGTELCPLTEGKEREDERKNECGL